MSISFKSNPFIDTVIFAGIDFKYETRLQGLGIKGEAAEVALKNLKESYEQHKASLDFKYGKFLKNVEKNLSEFNKPEVPSRVRHSVATKLSDLANRRISVKENHFSGFHKFFHKISQFFKGHGFRTKGEWGIALASRMKKVNSEIYKSRLEKCLFCGMNWTLEEDSPQQRLAEMKEEINQLPEAEFKNLLTEIIFKKKETDFCRQKNKLVFYKNLNEEKKTIFDDELLSRTDWYEQAFDIIEGADEEDLKAFISKKMISLFQSDLKIIQAYEKQDPENAWCDMFFKMIIEATIKDYLDNKKFIEISLISLKIGFYTNSRISARKLLESPILLTPEDMQKLNANVRI